jgi:capsid protein
MAAVRHGPATWYERVAPEHRDELNAIKAAWKNGELGSRRKTLARAIAANMRARGISDVGEQGVISWLDKA